jgi:hypothetical protein
VGIGLTSCGLVDNGSFSSRSLTVRTPEDGSSRCLRHRKAGFVTHINVDTAVRTCLMAVTQSAVCRDVFIYLNVLLG